VAHREAREPLRGRRLLSAGAVVLFLALFGSVSFGHATSKPQLGSATAKATTSVTLVDTTQTGEVVAGSPQTAAPGSVVGLKVSATLGTSEKWYSTSWAIGDGQPTCANTANHGSTGAATETITGVTLPETTPSPASVTVRLYPEESCAGTSIGTATGSFAIGTVTHNPTLVPSCDARVVLVLDESYSIYQTSGAVTGVRNGAKAFVNGLVGSGAQIAVVEFNSQARTVPLAGSTYNTVSSTFASGAFANYINGTGPGETYSPGSYSSPNYYTNWSDAFVKVRALSPQPQLVVFLTDGDPTARNIATSPFFQTGFTNGAYAALNPAFEDANALKASGAHVFVIGVGAALTSGASQVRLRAISGNNQFPQTSLVGADYTLLTDFSQLQEALSQLSYALCSVQVQVTKLVDDTGKGTYAPQNGWSFTGNVTVSGSANDSYRWLLPGTATGPPSGGNTRTDNTATTLLGPGNVNFVWLSSPTSLSSTIALTDVGKDGYHFSSVSCTKNGAPLQVENKATITISGLANNDNVACVFKDQKDTGQLKVAKVFQGTPTTVSLLINGETKITGDGQTFATDLVTVPAGTQQVSEVFKDTDFAALYASSYVCRDQDGHSVASGPGTVVAGGVPVNAGAVVTCTFTNAKDVSLTVAKTADPTTIDEPGGEVEFTVVVTNTTNAPVTLTKLTDSVFGNLDSHSAASDHSWITSDCVIGVKLAANDGKEGGPDSYTCNFVGNVTASPQQAHEDTVTAQITDASGETLERDATATVTGLDVLPSITVHKTADPSLLEGPGEVTYTAVITNTSVADTVRIDQLSDSIYGNLITGIHRAACTYGGDKVDLPYDLPVGESLVCTFSVTPSQTQTDTVTASGLDPEGNRATDSDDALVTVVAPPTPPTTTPGPQPTPTPEPTPPPPTTPAPPPVPGTPQIALAVAKRAPVSAQISNAGVAAFAYDIRVSNAGPDPAPNTTLTDPAPSGARFVRITHQPSQNSCSITGNGSQLRCNLGTLIANQSVDVQVDVEVRSSGGQTTNVATASCSPQPSTPCTAKASATTRLEAPFTPPSRPKPKPPAPKPPAPKPPAPKPPAPKRPAPKPPAPKPPAPSQPTVTCQTVSIKGSLEASGRPQTITIAASHNGTPAAAGTRLRLRGPGISRALELGARGTATVTLSPRSPGTLTISQPGAGTCAATTINIVGVSAGNFTG
jgi:uncharacterized repeat protein (TIGR01451 family)